MAVKRYDGSAWQVVAGKGDQGTSSSISTWVKTASGGETSLSGNDDNSQSLSYTVGQELVFINGTLLKRGSDYTATNGTSITGLTALAANDVATVWTVNAFSVTNAISNTLVDAKGDLIVATAADTPARLAVGSANQVLTVDSSTATGLKWATPAAGGKVLQVVQATYSTSTAINTATDTDTGLSASITPSSASSKILVLVSQKYKVNNASDRVHSTHTLLRGATVIVDTGGGVNTGYDGYSFLSASSGGNPTTIWGRSHFMYLDSPSTTSSTTYKTQASSQANGTVTYQAESNLSSMILMEIGV